MEHLEGLMADLASPRHERRSAAIAVVREAVELRKDEESLEKLAQAISDKLYGSYAILPNGDDFISGEHVWLFDYGDSGAAQFVAEEHYAVGDSGAIFKMNILTGEYERIK